MNAATITAKTIEGLNIIAVEGELEAGDERKFIDAALPFPAAIVFLEGPGGRISAATEIGRAIRLKGFVTIVADGSTCASGCALAWLGGRKRLMGASARIGFHAAWKTLGDGTTVTAGSGNALVGAYLNQLGLPLPAIAHLTEAPPESMRWLARADAQQLGIDFEFLAPPTASLLPPTTPNVPSAQVPTLQAPTSPTIDWTAQGEWVQAASRPTLADAVEIAREIQNKNPNTAVFRYANGWFGVVIGPFSIGRGEVARAALVGADEVPADSLVTRGQRFVELSWGSPKPAAVGGPLVPVGSGPADAVAIARRFHSTWSDGNPVALSFLATMYDEQIAYHGKIVPKTTVMEEKRKFADRWTQRRYTPRSDLNSFCDPNTRECVVAGTIDWDAYSPERGLRSVGSAHTTLTLRFGPNGPRIVGESATILTRERTRVQPVQER